MIDISLSPVKIQKGIAQRLKQIRKSRKITQKKLSELADVSYGSIKRFEQSGEISLFALTKIAIVLNREDDLNELFAQKEFASLEELMRSER